MINRTIAALQNFLRTDIRYLASGSFWLTIGKGSGTLVALFLSILYARYLPKEFYGNYRYVLSVFGMLGIFALPGIATTITRGVARGFEGTFLAGARLIFFSSFIITLLGFGIAGLFFLKGNAALGFGFAIAAILTPFAEGLGNWRAYFDGLRRFRDKTSWNIIASVFQGIFMASAVLAIGHFSLSLWESLALLVGVFYLGQAFPNVIWHMRTRRFVKSDAVSEPGWLRYGFHLTLLEVPATFSYYLDSVLLHLFLGPSALAIYSFAIAPAEQMKAFLGTIATTALPKLAVRTHNENSFQELRATLPGKIFRVTIFSVLLVGCYIIAAPILFAFLFPAYAEAVKFSQVFALSLLLFPFSVFHTSIQAEGNLKRVYWDQLSWPIVQIGALLLLIPLFGIWGAVAGKIIGRLFNNFMSFYLFKYR